MRQAEAQKAELLKRQATLVDELQRLTDSLAAGGESRSLRQGITLREAEAARIDRELARIARGTATRSAEAATQVLEALLPEWRAALRKHAPEARQMLRKLVTGRVVVTPEERHEQPGYRVRGVATVEPLLNVVLRSDVAQSIVSPPARKRTGSCKNVAVSGSAQAVPSPTSTAEVYWELPIAGDLAMRGLTVGLTFKRNTNTQTDTDTPLTYDVRMDSRHEAKASYVGGAGLQQALAESRHAIALIPSLIETERLILGLKALMASCARNPTPDDLADRIAADPPVTELASSGSTARRRRTRPQDSSARVRWTLRACDGGDDSRWTTRFSQAGAHGYADGPVKLRRQRLEVL